MQIQPQFHECESIHALQVETLELLVVRIEVLEAPQSQWRIVETL
jgi:hypothetical protein